MRQNNHKRSKRAQFKKHKFRNTRDKLVVITGLSGSGKSSLAFDTYMQKDKEDM